jgi:prophage regulatory protein
MEKILRLNEVIALTGLSRATIYEKQSSGEFPHSIKLGSRAVGWLGSEISDWINERIEESREDGEQ